MKVLLLNGSPKPAGNTAFALGQMAEVLQSAGIDTEIIQVGSALVPGCTGCGACYKLGRCVREDLVNEVAAKLQDADGLVLGSPVYFASPNGALITFLDRLFYSTGRMDKRRKVGACVVCARRGGTTAALDVLNKYITYAQMPLASSVYWNIIHGARPGEASQDAEGVRTVRTLAANMGYLIRALDLTRDQLPLPEPEPRAFTNFIR